MVDNLIQTDDLMRQFHSGLAKLRYELEKNLLEIDVLDKEKLENVLTIFNQRLIIFQHEFLDFLAKIKGGMGNSARQFIFEVPSFARAPEMATGILAAGGAGLLVTLIPVGTSGFWLWASSISAAAAGGAALGVPAGIFTAGVGIVAGAVCGIATAVMLKKRRRKLVHDAVLEIFDTKVSSQLESWAKARIMN